MLNTCIVLRIFISIQFRRKIEVIDNSYLRHLVMLMNNHLLTDVPESVLCCEYLVRGIFRNSFFYALIQSLQVALQKEEEIRIPYIRANIRTKNKILHVGIFLYEGHY